jgi:hypothetical protein
MTPEYATIQIRRYRSPDGQPTCCADHPAGMTCPYLGSRRMGSVDVCLLGEPRDLAPRTLGYQRPHDKCAVWDGAR